MSKISVIMDVDTGVDEAFALAFAVYSNDIDLLAVTTTFGVRPVKQCTENTLKILQLLGATDIPVAAGAKKGILSQLRVSAKASLANGEDGLCGVAEKLNAPTMSTENINAVQLMARTVSESKQNVILVATGPLTNIAIFLLSHPELHAKIDGIAMMGGAAFGGDSLPSAEFNVVHDPEAADIVFGSGIRVLMCGLDATKKAYIQYNERKRLEEIDNPVSKLLVELLKAYADHFENPILSVGCPIQAPLPIAWLIDASIIETKPYYVKVDLDGRYTRGCTVTDTKGILKKPPNTVVAINVNREEYVNMLLECLSVIK